MTILAALLLAAAPVCDDPASRETGYDPGLASTMLRGAEEADVVALLGPPESREELPDGRRRLTWHYTHRGRDGRCTLRAATLGFDARGRYTGPLGDAEVVVADTDGT